MSLRTYVESLRTISTINTKRCSCFLQGKVLNEGLREARLQEGEKVKTGWITVWGQRLRCVNRLKHSVQWDLKYSVHILLSSHCFFVLLVVVFSHLKQCLLVLEFKCHINQLESSQDESHIPNSFTPVWNTSH